MAEFLLGAASRYVKRKLLDPVARRLHSTLNYVSPVMFEKNWAAARQGQAA